jgi:hypothetical protein
MPSVWERARQLEKGVGVGVCYIRGVRTRECPGKGPEVCPHPLENAGRLRGPRREALLVVEQESLSR